MARWKGRTALLALAAAVLAGCAADKPKPTVLEPVVS